MHETGPDDRATRLAQKRAAVLGARRRGRGRLGAALAAAALAVAAGGYAALPGGAAGGGRSAGHGAMFDFAPSGGVVEHPLADLAPGVARYYQHKAGRGRIVRYFLVGLPGGGVHAALDACADCWQARRGHRQEGDELVCPNCRKRFPLADLGAAADPCAPLPLALTVAGGTAAVQVAELAAGAKYFPAPGEGAP